MLFWTPLTFIVWIKIGKTFFFKISSFMLHGRKKVIQVWNDVNYDNFHFGGGGFKEEETSMKFKKYIIFRPFYVDI